MIRARIFGAIGDIVKRYLDEPLRWWMEATAEWAQQVAVSNDSSYIGFISGYLNSTWQRLYTRPPLGVAVFHIQFCSLLTSSNTRLQEQAMTAQISSK